MWYIGVFFKFDACALFYLKNVQYRGELDHVIKNADYMNAIKAIHMHSFVFLHYCEYSSYQWLLLVYH